jgi:sigma-B regulation protein RsbQ
MPSQFAQQEGVKRRNNVRILGRGRQPIVFAHGFGCDQNMWRFVAPAFEGSHRIVLFDHVGAGGSDASAYDQRKYVTLDGYATDVLEICEALQLENVVFVGHSVSAMIGVLAANREPERFAALVMVGPSPRYINDTDYVGGFSSSDIEGLLSSLDDNYLGWSSAMAPAIMGNLFARVTFFSDNRKDLPAVRTPTLVLQCSDDIIAPHAVGEYVHHQIPGSRLVVMQATGHCPNLSAPDETVGAIRAFLQSIS